MFTKKIIALAVLTTVLAPIGVDRAFALSCLPVDMYLKDVVGKEEVVIFEATTIDRIEDKNYTAEVVHVTEAKQGFVEDTLFVYHEKHPDWGYLCNNGPKAKEATGIYVATRNDQNQYSVHQRLDLTDPLVKQLDRDLADADVEGGVSEITKTDRMNQIMTGVMELLSQITILLKEYTYWSKN